VEYTPLDGGVTFVADVAPRTGEIIKNGLTIFERGEDLLQNETYTYYSNRQESRCKVRMYTDEKRDQSTLNIKVFKMNSLFYTTLVGIFCRKPQSR